MKMISVLRCSLVILVFSAIGCNHFETGDNTTTGAAAGGVVGAGLGAVVGNQVGNTAEGAAIGAIAGAGTGAAFGSVFDRQQATMRDQDEAIERQERVILAQQNELKELRKLGQDSVSFKEQSYSNAPVVDSKEFSFPSAPPVRVANNSMGRAAAPTSMPSNAAAARAPMPAFPTAPRTPRAATGSYEKPAAQVQERSLVVEQDPEPVRPVTNTQLQSSDMVRGSYGWNNSANSAPKPRVQPEPVVQQRAPEPVAPAPVPVFVDRGIPTPPQAQVLSLNTPECHKAEDEAKSALTARDAADKLFHYRRALRLCPDNANFHNGLGEVYISLNRNEDARYEFREALRLNPAHSGAQANLTRVP